MTAQKIIVHRKFAFTLAKPHIDRISKLLAYAGIDSPSEIWIGSRLLISMLFAGIGFLLPFSALRFAGFFGTLEESLSAASIIYMVTLSIGLAIVFFYAAAFIMYLHLYYIIHDRAKRVEDVLPDFLLMVAANLRAGMTPFAAFQASARPEFGPLEKEIRVISARAMGSESFVDALGVLSTRIDSPTLQRTISFFENGLRSGGKLAQLLETSAGEIREIEELRREIVLTTKTYSIFLVFILVMGLPLLLSISTEFLGTFSKIQKNLSGADLSNVANFMVPKLSIDVGFITQMSWVIIVGTSLLISVLIGVISEGKVLYGLKYFIPLAFASSAMFLIFKTLISGFIGQLV